jgi:hypothetical protein
MSGRHQLSKSSWYKSLQEIPYEDEAVSSKVRCSIMQQAAGEPMVQAPFCDGTSDQVSSILPFAHDLITSTPTGTRKVASICLAG